MVQEELNIKEIFGEYPISMPLLIFVSDIVRVIDTAIKAIIRIIKQMVKYIVSKITVIISDFISQVLDRGPPNLVIKYINAIILNKGLLAFIGSFFVCK
jgi:hypothetical protein